MPRLLTLRPSHRAIPRWVATTLAAGSLVAGTLAANASAAETITSEFPDDVLVHTGPGGDALSVLNPMGPLTEASDADPVDIVRGYLRTFRSEFGLTGGGLNSLTLDSVITDPDGVTHVSFRQVVDGIDVFRAVITGAVDSSGRLVHIGGDVADVAPETDSDADVTAADAIAAAAQSVADTDVDAGDLPDEADTTRPEEVSVDNVLAEGVIDPTPLSAKKRWYMVDDGRALRLAWVTDVELSGHQWFESVVDAETGTVLEESSRYAHAAPEGRVYDVQHPDVAGATRALRPFSGIGGTWVSGTTTSGNNVNAYRDLDDSDANDEYQPSDAGQVFDYAFTDAWRVNADGSNASLDADIDAVITQLFYYTNLVHDYTYDLGFTETWRNFQVDNFGNGGADGDPVLAEAQDGWDFGCPDGDSTPNEDPDDRCRNNANFGTPSDGNSPRMQMYMWSPTRPWRDGSMDGDVIAHEYGHGVSTRLVGGGTFDYANDQTGALGEGWSDILSFLMWGDTTIGEYVTGNTARGIRSTAYDTSTLMYDDYNPASGSPHPNGEIWATMIYDVRDALGIAYTEQQVIDAMKLTNVGSKPMFIDARNGLIAAEVADGGTNLCQLWSIFAQRGLGLGATAVGPNGDGNQTNDFEIPVGCQPTADAGGPYVTDEGSDAAVSAAGSATGTDPSAGAIVSWEWDFDNDGSYDDASGEGASFDLVGQDGVFSIGLRVTDAFGNTATDTATVTVDNVAPTVTIDSIAPIDEETRTATISGTISDPGWLDDLSATIEYDDGASAVVLPGTEENVRPDATLQFSVTHDYGDNGDFSVEVCGADDDTQTCQTTIASVANIAPGITIDSSSTQVYDGVQAFVVDAGSQVTVPITVTDPGSDDLDVTWDWDDGTTSQTTTLVNPPADDPPKSPTVQPRDEDLSADHTYSDACLYDLVTTVTDDDGGTEDDSAAVVVVGNATTSKAQGWWKNQYRVKNPNDFSTAQLECYLDIVVFFSTVFDTPMVRADAVAVFQTPAKSPATELFDLHALAAWLNVANGSVALSTPVDVGGVSTTFGAAMLAAEDVRTNVASTDAEVRAAQEVVSYLATVSE